jgi:nucleoside-diphosphate-sugar epimerase
VLVTGATGFVGANVVRALLERGAEVHILVRPASDTWRLQDVWTKLHAHTATITDVEALERAFAATRPTVVLHLATPRGQDDLARIRILQDVIVGAERIGRLVRKYAVERLVVSGSSFEYGPSDVPMREDLPLRPTTVHGIAKAAASLLLRQMAVEHGTPVCVLRLFHVYGPWESAHRLFPTAMRAAFDGIPVRLTSPGIRRDWVYVDDVVDAMFRAVGLDAPGEIFNIGSGREYSNEDVVACIREITGRPIETLVGAYPARIGDVAHRCADRTKAAECMGWAPRHDLAAGVRRTLEWWRTHPVAWSAPRDAPPAVC